MADKILDVRGLMCPLPVLKAKKALRDVPPGGTLEVLATDPNASSDFEDFCGATGTVLAEQSEAGGVYRFLLKKPA